MPPESEQHERITRPMEVGRPHDDLPVRPDGSLAGVPLRETELAVRDKLLSIEEEEHQTYVRRLRPGVLYGIIAWILFSVVDWIAVRFVEPSASLARIVGLRGFGVLTSLLTLACFYKRPMPSRQLAQVADFFGYTTISVLITLMTLELRGLESPYASGIVTVIICRSIIMPDNYRRAFVLLGGPTIAYPVTIGVAALVDPRVAAQVHDTEALGMFLLSLSFILTAYAFTLVGGHTVWALRRQVYEARNIGRYKLKRLIGSGGMGQVWLAWHAGLKRDVAIKVMQPEAHADGSSAVARFEREVRATSELAHPNTVRLFDYGVTADGLWFYAMEHLVGADLSTVVAREGPLAPERAAHIGSQIARALAEAHARGIVHRDIKPQNVFVTELYGERDFVKVLDFGVAKLAKGEAEATLTNTGLMLGTPHYVSPEAASGKPTGPASDIYSLGCVLYFLLTGGPPFEGRAAGTLLFAHTTLVPDPPSSRAPSPLPEGLEQLVLRCLAKAPEDRPRSMTDVAAALVEIEGAHAAGRPAFEAPSLEIAS